MKTPDKLPEVRRSKIVLWTVAIGVVIAMTVIQVKKILDSEGEKSQKPVAAAPEKVGEDGNQDKKSVPQDSIISKDASPESLIEDDEFIGDCKPGSLQDACAILREADINSVQCDIYTAVNQAFAFSHEGETLEERWFYGVSDVFDECGLSKKQQEEVLRAGIQQGDSEIGAFVREGWIGPKCTNLYSESQDFVENQGRYETEKAWCEKMPTPARPKETNENMHTECTDIQKSTEESCKNSAFGEQYPLVCGIKGRDAYFDCVGLLLDKAHLSYRVRKKTPGNRDYCLDQAEQRLRTKETEWTKRCYRNLSQELGVDWEDVISLYRTHEAEDFVKGFNKGVSCDYHDVDGYLRSLQWLDVTHPDVLDILGVSSKDEIPAKYIEGVVEECVLTKYNDELECRNEPNCWEPLAGGAGWGMNYIPMEERKKGEYPFIGGSGDCLGAGNYCHEGYDI